jgi:hypothetical protein
VIRLPLSRRSGVTRRRGARRREMRHERGRTSAPLGAAARVHRATEPPAAEDAPAGGPAAARRIKQAIFFGALGLVLAVPVVLVARHVAANPFFRIRHVSVQASAHVSEAALRDLAGIDPGMPWFLFDAKAAEDRLEANAWVERAHVMRTLPGSVRISVNECKPVARIEVAGRTYGLCDDLRIIPSGDDSLPLVRGRARTKADPAALARGLEYFRALRKAGIAGKEPVELDVAADTGDCLALPSRGFTVTVDETVPVPVVIRNVLAFLETLDAEGGSRGTLRLVSSDTAVWRASTGRVRATG